MNKFNEVYNVALAGILSESKSDKETKELNNFVTKFINNKLGAASATALVTSRFNTVPLISVSLVEDHPWIATSKTANKTAIESMKQDMQDTAEDLIIALKTNMFGEWYISSLDDTHFILKVKV